MRRNSAGFTLMEMLMAVAIIGIIAAVAWPSYQEHVRQARRSVAQADLMELAQWMERRYSVNYNYTNAGANPALPFTQSPRTGTAYYNLSFAAAVSKDAFQLRAVPTGPQVGDRCGTLTLNQAGARGAAEANCW